MGFPSGSTMPLGLPLIRGGRVRRPSPTSTGFCLAFCNVRNIRTSVRSSTLTSSNFADSHQALPVRVLPTDAIVSLDARRIPREKTLQSNYILAPTGEIDSCIARPPHSPGSLHLTLARFPIPVITKLDESSQRQNGPTILYNL